MKGLFSVLMPIGAGGRRTGTYILRPWPAFSSSLNYTRMWQFDAICQRSVYHSLKVQPTLLGAVRKDVRLSCEQSGRPLPVAEKHSTIEVSTGMEVTSRGYSPSELHGAGPARLCMVNCREQ